LDHPSPQDQVFKTWPWLVGGAITLSAGWLLYELWHFFYYSPRLLLTGGEQIEPIGNHYVPRDAVVEKFAADRGRSVVRVPLDERRQALEEIPWVEQASVERILPNRIRVDLVERTPVAFLRLGSALALVDAQGVILERPLEGTFHFPVVTGIRKTMPREVREQRMKLYVQFLRDIEEVKPAATDHVSEANLADSKDLRAMLTGIQEKSAGASADAGPVLVHFGDGDFAEKYRALVENLAQWRAAAGRVESVDLRFARQVVVSPEGKSAAAKTHRPEEAGKSH
jgi:cell division protein FtsQ